MEQFTFAFAIQLEEKRVSGRKSEAWIKVFIFLRRREPIAPPNIIVAQIPLPNL
ncbi:hypothetical protein M527_14260 [Sphingobium indicum IP26]|nr:hypothetical protein M527_14260 [Sphingobium indicum IP26]EQA97546.1 hypothetical protein L286_22305 [Sphingobium sp. HDIP04]